MRQTARRIARQTEWAPPLPAARKLEITPARRDPAGWQLLQFVAAVRGVPTAKLLAPSRSTAEVALARQLAMYLMHVVLGRVYLDVGRFFGRDRTTVSYACALIEDMRDDESFDAEVASLEHSLQVQQEVRHVARA